MAQTPQPSDVGWANWLRELRNSWWAAPLLGGLLVVMFTNFERKSWTAIAADFGVFAFVGFCIGASVTAVYSFGIHRIQHRLRHPIVAGLGHLSALTVGVGVGSEISLRVLALFLDMGEDLQGARWTMWRIGFAVGFGVMFFSVLYDRLKEHARTAEQELLRAQLDALQARTNPHFLFNSLNTVASLIEEDAERAVTAVERLSDLLRYSLEGSRTDRVPLARELNAVTGYLELEGLRFGERLRTELDIEDDLGPLEVPPFVLQPVVENAVKHGIAGRREGGVVRVSVGRDAGRLVIRVEDDGPGVSDHAGTQTGEDNLRKRLEVIYGAAATFEAGPRDGGGYRVEIRLPLEPIVEAAE